jgi:sigma-B regulation protein RsbU (phosphoserine phosphatase)
MVLGVDKTNVYPPSKIILQPDDMLIMYTDGLADAANFDRESFGRKRIIDAALASASMTAEQAAKNILWLMRKFAGLNRRCDDIAIVVLKKKV